MILNDSEFLQLALNKYDNPRMTDVEEFQADIRRFGQLNKLLQRYVKDKSLLNDRLIINHIVIIGNCFTPEYSIPMMRYKTSDCCKFALDTFLFYMGLIEVSSIGLDFWLLEDLEKKHGRR